MVRDALEKIRFDFGVKLLKQLREINFPITDLLWNYYEEREEWQLVIVSRLVEEKGPLHCYGVVRKAIDHIPMDEFYTFSLSDVKVLAPGERLARSVENTLFMLYPAGEKARFKHIDHSYVGDSYIEDAYIYNLEAIS